MPPIQVPAISNKKDNSQHFSGTEKLPIKLSNKLNDDGDLYQQVLNSEKSSKNHSNFFEQENFEESDFFTNASSEDDLSSDDNSEFEYVSYSDDTDKESVDDEPETYENESLNDSVADKIVEQDFPFWFNNESEDHVKLIMEIYTEKFIAKNEFSRSSQPFIGCVKRYIKTCCSALFQTFDQISIKNNQRMDADKAMCDIREVYCFTTWNEDGLPSYFFQLDSEWISHWVAKFSYSELQPSYLYCFPDFHGQKESISDSIFAYSSSLVCKDVTYANLPWNATPYSNFIKPKQNVFLPFLIDSF